MSPGASAPRGVLPLFGAPLAGGSGCPVPADPGRRAGPFKLTALTLNFGADCSTWVVCGSGTPRRLRARKTPTTRTGVGLVEAQGSTQAGSTAFARASVDHPAINRAVLRPANQSGTPHRQHGASCASRWAGSGQEAPARRGCAGQVGGLCLGGHHPRDGAATLPRPGRQGKVYDTGRPVARLSDPGRSITACLTSTSLPPWLTCNDAPTRRGLRSKRTGRPWTQRG